MAFLKTLTLLSAALATVNAGCPVIPGYHNFTLTIDYPGFVLDGLEVIEANAGIFTNVSRSNVNYKPTYYFKNDSDTMFANFDSSNGFKARDWQFTVFNGTPAQGFSGRAGLSMSSGPGGPSTPSYTGSFFVIGDDDEDPWGSNPHLGFAPDDGIGNGGWWACPKWFDDSWRIFGGTFSFDGTEGGYPDRINCTLIGNLKANLVTDGGVC